MNNFYGGPQGIQGIQGIQGKVGNKVIVFTPEIYISNSSLYVTQLNKEKVPPSVSELASLEEGKWFIIYNEKSQIYQLGTWDKNNKFVNQILGVITDMTWNKQLSNDQIIFDYSNFNSQKGHFYINKENMLFSLNIENNENKIINKEIAENSRIQENEIVFGLNQYQDKELTGSVFPLINSNNCYYAYYKKKEDET